VRARELERTDRRKVERGQKSWEEKIKIQQGKSWREKTRTELQKKDEKREESWREERRYARGRIGGKSRKGHRGLVK